MNLRDNRNMKLKRYKYLFFTTLFGVTNFLGNFCCGKSKDKHLVSNIKNEETLKIVEKSNTSYFKTFLKISMGCIVTKICYESLFYLSYYLKRDIFSGKITPYNIDQYDISRMDLEERTRIVHGWAQDFIRKYCIQKNYSGVSSIGYSIADFVSFNNAKEMQSINEKRLLIWHKGICRNFALLLNYWFDKLGVPNHMVLEDWGNNIYHMSNIFYNGSEWLYDDFTNALWDIKICDENTQVLTYPTGVKRQINKNNFFVIESSKTWGNKFQSDLEIMSLPNFIQNNYEWSKVNTKKLGSEINLLQALTKYYKS